LAVISPPGITFALESFWKIDARGMICTVVQEHIFITIVVGADTNCPGKFAGTGRVTCVWVLFSIAAANGIVDIRAKRTPGIRAYMYLSALVDIRACGAITTVPCIARALKRTRNVGANSLGIAVRSSSAAFIDVVARCSVSVISI